MKKSTLILAAVLLFICMGCGRTMQIEVINPTDTDRLLELIEIPLDEIQSRLDLSENETFVLLDGHDTIPCQITFDRDVLFPCALNGNEKRRFEFKAGVPSEPVVKVCGAHYPERVDDICWENDIVGFRVYGFKEDKPSGYDIFTKKNTDLPVIPEMYRKALDPQARKLEDEIRKEFGKDSAARFNNRRSLKYSIIVPVYNRPDEVDELLESLCKQSFKDFEVIIVEDGSLVNCKDVCSKYMERLNMKYFMKQNSGPGLSRNYGAERSSGEYLIVLDSDVVLPEGYLQAVEDELQRQPADAFGGPDRAHDSFTDTQKAISYSMTSFM